MIMRRTGLTSIVLAMIICLQLTTVVQISEASPEKRSTRAIFRIHLPSGDVKGFSARIPYLEIEDLLNEAKGHLLQNESVKEFIGFLMERLQKYNLYRRSSILSTCNRKDGEPCSLAVLQRHVSSDDRTGVGIAILARIYVAGEGVTFPPLGIAWPVLFWFAKNSIGGAGNKWIGGYIVWGPSKGVAISFVGLEVSWFKKGKPVFALAGFTLASVAVGENVTQVSSLH
ncbi:MAG: hypothetical protein DRN13_01115 [Thermoplasmata archaeon]|nr:MAG: hypothetical protein DRN13_01115 [Thermoplasmata archaeon]